MTSECSIFRRWFERNWPVLSPSHGFNFLGLGMIVIGNNLLGNLNKEATSQENLGMPFWRIVIGAGVIVFAMGFINIIAVCRPMLQCLNNMLIGCSRSSSVIANSRSLPARSARKALLRSQTRRHSSSPTRCREASSLPFLTVPTRLQAITRQPTRPSRSSRLYDASCKPRDSRSCPATAPKSLHTQEAHHLQRPCIQAAHSRVRVLLSRP